MANNTLKQIATNLKIKGYDNTSLLVGIAKYYGVDIAKSTNLMGDILTALGGDTARSKNYIEDIVIALRGARTSYNWLEAWKDKTKGGIIGGGKK